MMTTGKAISIAVLAALTSGAPALAQETKTLKFHNTFPASHWGWVENGKVFDEALRKATGGKVQLEPYHASTLGKEGSTVLMTGLADIAMVIPSYEPSKVPLSSVAELPGISSSACEMTGKLWHIIKDGGPLHEAEYKRMGIKVLYVFGMAPYQVMTTKKKVTSLAELSGLKIRANGAAMDKTVRALGAIPVRVVSNELYEALQRGTIDGGLWTIGSTRAVGLESLYKFTAQGPALGAGSGVVGIRQKVWDALPKDQQAALMKAGAETQKHLCQFLDNLDVEVTNWLVKEHGLVPTMLSKEETARWMERMTPIAIEWAKEMDASGRPGSALLKAVREAPAK